MFYLIQPLLITSGLLQQRSNDAIENSLFPIFPSLPFSLPFSVPFIIVRIHRDCNLLVQPVPARLVRNRDEWTISSALQDDAHARALLADGLDVLQRNLPFGGELP